MRKHKGVSYSDFLPYWSKVENLTIHQPLAQIDPGAGRPRKARMPVNEIDVALYEEVVRDLGNATARAPATCGRARARRDGQSQHEDREEASAI